MAADIENQHLLPGGARLELVIDPGQGDQRFRVRQIALNGHQKSLVSDLRGRIVWVPEDKRTLYHAGLAHGANHLVTLVAEAMELLRASGAEDPASTLRPLLTAALDNALSFGDAALTGPIVRGDVETVRAHVRDIARKSGGHATLFRARERAADPFHPLPEAMMQLHRRLKQTFDPSGIFNRGRLYPDL